MKKKLILGLGLIVAVAAITAGVTYAVFQYQTPSVVNVMTAGNVQIELIEQQRDGKGGLEAFEQGKSITPLVGSAQMDKKDAYGMPEIDNYQDKIISVKNTGANGAYVRVLMAVPAVLDNLGSADGALHVNIGNRVELNGKYTEEWGDAWKTNWHWDYTSVDPVTIKINGVDYHVYSYTFTDVLESGAQSSAAIAGVYLDKNVQYKDGAYYFNGTKLEGFNGVVTMPVLAQAVQSDGYTNAVAALEETFPLTIDNATTWFNNEKFISAAPKSEAVRPAGYNPITEGTNLVDGITVIDNSDEKTNLRALYTEDGKITGNLTVINSYLDGTYAMNPIGDGTGVLTVSNTALRGWVSYGGFKSATFTNTTFAQNTNAEIYNTVRPYSEVTFTNCEFNGTDFWLDQLPEGAKATFVNCTMNGELIKEAADLTITYGTADSVVIANS